MGRNTGRFHFDGGAATYLGTGILAFLVTLCTLGICYPFALVLRERWRAKHTYIDGARLTFTGTGLGLFGLWIKWFVLCLVTLGIYLFWVGPRVQKWKVEHTDFDPTWVPRTLANQPGPAIATQPQAAQLPAQPSQGQFYQG